MLTEWSRDKHTCVCSVSFQQWCVHRSISHFTRLDGRVKFALAPKRRAMFAAKWGRNVGCQTLGMKCIQLWVIWLFYIFSACYITKVLYVHYVHTFYVLVWFSHKITIFYRIMSRYRFVVYWSASFFLLRLITAWLRTFKCQCQA